MLNKRVGLQWPSTSALFNPQPFPFLPPPPPSPGLLKRLAALTSPTDPPPVPAIGPSSTSLFYLILRGEKGGAQFPFISRPGRGGRGRLSTSAQGPAAPSRPGWEGPAPEGWGGSRSFGGRGGAQGVGEGRWAGTGTGRPAPWARVGRGRGLPFACTCFA